MKKHILLCLAIFVLTTSTKAQFLQDIQGRPILELRYTDVKGTPYLYESWITGSVILMNGQTFSDIPLKFDIYEDKLFFKKGDSENLLEFVEPVKSFKFSYAEITENYENGFPGTDKFSDKTFYKVLYNGNTKLLHKIYKTQLTLKPYNSATTEKSFIEHNEYYLLKDNQIVKFKNNKKDILSTLSDKSNEMDKFIKQEHVDFKKNSDLIKIISHYDSLKSN